MGVQRDEATSPKQLHREKLSARGVHNDTVPFWGRISRWRSYQLFVEFLFGSERRHFLILAGFPLLWVLTQHLGPILQMLHISVLDAYPVTVGTQTHLSLEHYRVFFEEPVYRKPFLRTLVYAFSLTLVTLLLVYPVAYFLALHVNSHNQHAYLLL